MSRPTHIAALDGVVFHSLDRLAAEEDALSDFLEENIAVIDKYTQLRTKRANAFYDVRNAEDAIRKLGYVVLKPGGGTVPKQGSNLDGKTLSIDSDEAAAREHKSA